MDGELPASFSVATADDILDALDPEQREVAANPTGPMCVLAGAGTGKTRAITHRIAYGCATGAYDPVAVLAAMRKALPEPVDHFLTQADLTLTVPGPMTPELAEQVELVADLEGRGPELPRGRRHRPERIDRHQRADDRLRRPVDDAGVQVAARGIRAEPVLCARRLQRRGDRVGRALPGEQGREERPRDQ